MFKNWFENNLVQDAGRTAQWWLQNLPQKPVEVIEAGIHAFVSSMSDESKNGEAIDIIFGGRQYHDSRYDKTIARNLLDTESRELKRAVGIVSSIEPVRFAFRMEGKDAGWLFIVHPPAIYIREDEQALEFIIRHELNHAEKWLDATVRGTTLPPSTDAIQDGHWDNDRYANNLYEASAYADQLGQMMVRFDNDVDKVVKILQGSPDRPRIGLAPSFNMDHDILRVAVRFLDRYRKRNENMSRFLGPAALAASSLFSPQNTPSPLIQPQGMVKRVDDQAVRQAAQLVSQIVNLMRFKNFVR